MINPEDMNQSKIILEARDIRVVRGGTLLLNTPSLLIQEGEVLSLIGPNGAGKTTLLQALSYLHKPSQGEILVKGETIQSNHSAFRYRRKIAMVFQEPLLFDTTVFENVASGLRIRGMKGSEIQTLVDEQLERFGIAHLGQRSARTLSGGEAQRTSLARAFAIHPEILFLDEPFASLDPPSRESLIGDLELVLKQTGTTAVFATHDRLESLRLSDRIAVMKDGKIVQIGSPEAVMSYPVDEFVASFVGVETILKGMVKRQNSETFVTSVSGSEIEAVGKVPVGEIVFLCIRPENVTLSTNASRETTSARNVFQGRIEKITSLGPYQKVRLNCGFPLVAYVTRHSLEKLLLKEGKEVVAAFKATGIHVIRKNEIWEEKG
jgi:tungstate transport system ATP-binding protein